MIDYENAYAEIKASPFKDSNSSYDLREPYGWMPSLAHREAQRKTMLIQNFVLVYWKYDFDKEETMDYLDISERVYDILIPGIKSYFTPLTMSPTVYYS